MIEAYKAEFDLKVNSGTDPHLAIAQIKEAYSLTNDDLPGHETWIAKPTKNKRTKKIDKVLEATAGNSEQPGVIVVKPSLPVTPAVDSQLEKIENFKKLALDHCIHFMEKDAKFAEVKEFKDIVAIVDTLEKSYQKTDPEAGKPTINIMINNLMERFKDDC
jgi:hypothetical protein